MQKNIKYFIFTATAITDKSAKKRFGKIVAAFRKHYKLSQQQLAALTGSDRTYVGKVERGKVNVGINFIEKLAGSIGAEYYEIVNPDFKFPALDSLKRQLREGILTARAQKEVNKSESRQPLADYLDRLLVTKYLHTARTGKQIADRIKVLYDVETTSGKVTALLTRHPRNQIVHTVSAEEWGGRGNKYILKKVHENALATKKAGDSLGSVADKG